MDGVTPCALVAASGTRCRLGPEGVVIGRSARCDVIIDGPTVSRVQVIIHVDPEGPLLTVVGRAATLVNGQKAEGQRRLRPGDVLAIEAYRYDVVEDAAPASPSTAAWMVRDRGGQLFGVTRADFAIGGGAGAALRVGGWPERVAVLHASERLTVEAVEPVAIDGVVLEPGELAIAEVDAELTYRDSGFRVIAGGAAHSAVTTGGRGAPDRVTLELLPRGGRLVVGWGAAETAIYLPERRCELVALLLQPPSPYAAGELIPDEVVFGRLGVQRVQLNVLIHRTRADLVRAGLDGVALIERAPGGSATRFPVDARARVGVL